MVTNLEKTFHVDEPIDKVWDYLSDPSKIVPCVPGASLTEKIDDRNYKGAVSMKFGPIKASYSGMMTFEEIDLANRKMVLKGKGLDDKGTGSADMLLNGILVEKDGGTEVNYTMEITVVGKLAQFGSRLITDVSNQVFDTFIDNFKNTLQVAVPEGIAGEAAAPAEGPKPDTSINVFALIWSLIKNAIDRLFGRKKV